MKVEKFFQETGVDISSPKSMFEFINEHYRYHTMNSWNGLKSIANKVKIYTLCLSGDPYTALRHLEAEEYCTVNEMISDWEDDHPGYSVGFNGSSGGYLVLYNEGNMKSVVPDEIDGYDSYEDWKEDVKNYGYKVNDFIRTLRDTTELIRDFDRLCDELRSYVDTLSTTDFASLKIQQIVEDFNDQYEDDLKMLQYAPLEVDKNNQVDISEIVQMNCLREAFCKIANRYHDQGYQCEINWDTKTARLVED